MSKDTVCPTCSGTGKEKHFYDTGGGHGFYPDCPACFGTGRVTNSPESPARDAETGTDDPRGPKLREITPEVMDEAFEAALGLEATPTPEVEPETETYVAIQMDGFSKLILDKSDTLQTMLEMFSADWPLDDPIKMTVGSIEMTAKDFEELPEWEA